MLIDVLLYPIGMLIFLYFMVDMNKIKKKWDNGSIQKFLPYFILTTFLIVISIYMGFWLVANHDMSWIKPMRSGLVIILISITGFFLYNETFSMKKILGTLLIVSGIVTMNS